MKQSTLPDHERSICLRFGEIRKRSGLSHSNFAKEIGLPVGSVSNYEYGKTALRADIALKVCHTFLANERWLATGEGDWQPCVDLYLELPVLMKLKRGEPYSEAYHRVLSSEHDLFEQMPDNELILRLLTCELNTEERINRIFTFTRHMLQMMFSCLKIGMNEKKNILQAKDDYLTIDRVVEPVLKMRDVDFLCMFYEAGIQTALDFLTEKGLQTNPYIPAMRAAQEDGESGGK